MNTLRDRVLQLLTDSEKPLTLPKISKALGLTMRQNGVVQRELTILHREHRVHVANGGGWSLRRDADASNGSAPRPRSGLGAMQRRIFAVLDRGQATRAELIAALPEKKPLDVDQALHRMVKLGQVVRVRPGVYAPIDGDIEGPFEPDEETETPEPSLPPDAGVYSEAVRDGAKRLIAEARERRQNGTAALPVVESPNHGAALPEFAPGVLQEACPPRADLRDLLMRGAERVLAGHMGKDGAEALVELVDAMLAIDLGEVGA